MRELIFCRGFRRLVRLGLVAAIAATAAATVATDGFASRAWVFRRESTECTAGARRHRHLRRSSRHRAARRPRRHLRRPLPSRRLRLLRRHRPPTRTATVPRTGRTTARRCATTRPTTTATGSAMRATRPRSAGTWCPGRSAPRPGARACSARRSPRRRRRAASTQVFTQHYDQFGASWLNFIRYSGGFRVCYVPGESIVSWGSLWGDASYVLPPWDWRGNDGGYPRGVRTGTHTVEFHFRGSAAICVVGWVCGPTRHPGLTITFFDNNTMIVRSYVV